MPYRDNDRERNNERDESSKIGFINIKELGYVALTGDLSRLLPIQFKVDLSDTKCLAELFIRLISYFRKRIEEEAERTGVKYVDLVPIMKIVKAQLGEGLRKLGLSDQDLLMNFWVEVCLDEEEIHVFNWFLSILYTSIDNTKVRALIEDLRRMMIGNCIRTPSIDRLLRMLTQLDHFVKDYIIEETWKEAQE